MRGSHSCCFQTASFSDSDSESGFIENVNDGDLGNVVSLPNFFSERFSLRFLFSTAKRVNQTTVAARFMKTYLASTQLSDTSRKIATSSRDWTSM